VRRDEREFVLADIPGLIEGAHEGHGLGDRFLGHVERCRALLHLIDATGEHAGRDYKTVRRELAAYGAELDAKPEIVALSKIDAVGAEHLKKQRERLKRAMPRPGRRTGPNAPRRCCSPRRRGRRDRGAAGAAGRHRRTSPRRTGAHERS